jgi:hypothetical protein
MVGCMGVSITQKLSPHSCHRGYRAPAINTQGRINRPVTTHNKNVRSFAIMAIKSLCYISWIEKSIFFLYAVLD